MADGVDIVLAAMPKLLEIFASVYDKKVPQDQDVFADDEVLMAKSRPLIQSLVKQYQSQFSPQYGEILATLQANNHADLVATLERIVASS